MEAEGDVLGYGAGGDDGNGVVGGAEIGDADQGGDAEFGSPLAADVAGQPGDDERMVSSMPPASRVMMMSSPMPVMPVPMAPNQSKKAVPV